MIIIRLRSGLGNQMFQYAFFKQMQAWHGDENVKLDISTYHWKVHNGREIDKIFDIDLSKDSVPSKVSLKYADVGYQFHHRALRRLRGIKHRSYRFWKNIAFEEYRHLDDVYLEGYWNEEKYFKDVEAEIRETYQFDVSLNSEESELLELINNKESVAVHVRRGDYVKYPNAFPMCKPSYYQQAQSLLERKGKKFHYFVFSDDLDWCKQELQFLENVSFVENPNKSAAFKDMFFMSQCKHNIIANSTFSWWSAWLNNNPDKTVIYPESALKTYGEMPLGWIKL